MWKCPFYRYYSVNVLSDVSDDEDSGDDDGEVPSRSTIRKQSQNIVDSKTKRRISKKKKKTK